MIKPHKKLLYDMFIEQSIIHCTQRQTELNKLANEIGRKTGHQVYVQKRIVFFHKLKKRKLITNQDKRFSIWFAETGEEHFFLYYSDAISFLEAK